MGVFIEDNTIPDTSYNHVFFIWKYHIETFLLVAFPNKNLMVLTLKLCIKFYSYGISGKELIFFFFILFLIRPEQRFFWHENRILFWIILSEPLKENLPSGCLYLIIMHQIWVYL